MAPRPTTSLQRRRFGQAQRGLSLVEVLVTLVSTSVGLLGIAALQLVSVRSNQEAIVRLRALRLATSMIENLRANTPARLVLANVSFNGTGDDGNAPLAREIGAWQHDIDRSLPGGDTVAAGSIERVAASNAVRITVRWGVQGREAGAEERATNQLQIRTEL